MALVAIGAHFGVVLSPIIYFIIEYSYRGRRRSIGNYYLAIDIEASSGRHILGHLKDEKMVLEEMRLYPIGLIDETESGTFPYIISDL
ncbi:hypothetical protein [Clostridium tagluense]|uniref:hypothetical protein n=1 Tax=Clostridium tagluense TaxID=360422 RepID=UPI001CF229F8|nr:hypothetical protein [Clostridium tagluense]MCB2298551.1 hypothetical protein [Clostridium tagluense]